MSHHAPHVPSTVKGSGKHSDALEDLNKLSLSDENYRKDSQPQLLTSPFEQAQQQSLSNAVAQQQQLGDDFGHQRQSSSSSQVHPIDLHQQHLVTEQLNQQSADSKANTTSTPAHITMATTASERPAQPVIDEEGVLEQCGDWAFVVELLDDILNDKDQMVDDLQSAVDSNDHVKFYKTAHALKGAALNLHLPGIVDVSKAAEMLGKELEKQGGTDQAMLDERQGHVDQLKVEYKRLEDYMPEARANAEAEGGGGDY